jgi:hypothetical protein
MTGESFAAITEPDVMLSASIFSRPIAGRVQVWLTLRTAAGIYDEIVFTVGRSVPCWPFPASWDTGSTSWSSPATSTHPRER